MLWVFSMILGEMVQVKGYVFDDTERKEAEEALKQSEEKYHRLFDEDLTGDFIATLDGKILECNPAFAEIYGFDNCNMHCSGIYQSPTPLTGRIWSPGSRVKVKSRDFKAGSEDLIS